MNELEQLKCDLALAYAYIITRTEPPRDHACDECVRECNLSDDITKVGFRCVFHKAKNRLLTLL